MRISQFHVFWALVLAGVVWSSELAGPPTPGASVRQVSIPLPPAAAKPVAAVPATPYPDSIQIATDTCFERVPEAWLTAEADEYAPYADFATGVEGAAIILAVYKPRQGVAWDYADRCNAPAFYKHAKIVKKLRSGSLANDVPHGWIQGASWSNSAHSSKKGGYGVLAGSPNVLDSGRGGFGGGQGFAGNTGAGGDGKGDTPDGKNPPNPGGDGPGDGHTGTGPGDTGPGDPGSGNPGSGDPDPSHSGPGGQNPGDPGYPGGSDPIAVPEPGTLALFLSLTIGFALIRRRVSKI